ncbi:MAG: hypothetical protein WCK03_01660 [Candidatus Taylorbacteria bacterium]
MKNILSLLNYSCIGLVVLALLFVTFEPAISIGATTDSKQFTISQTVTNEVAFTSSPTNVVMSPQLGGITGGTATGQTQFAVMTNNLTGYKVTITASSTTGAMQGTASTTNYIPGYIPAVATAPDYAMSVLVNKAGFAYSVQASTTSDVGDLFHENGSACNTGANHTNPGTCWYVATSTAATIINRPLPTLVGAATSTILFKVIFNGTPSPMIPNDTYVATTTLTATMN